MHYSKSLVIVFFVCALSQIILVLLLLELLLVAHHALQDVTHVLIPLQACISHTEVDLCGLLSGGVGSLFSQLHSTVKMSGSRSVVSLLSQQLTQLKESASLTFTVLEFLAQLQVSLYEHLKLVLVHLRVDFSSAYLTQVTYGDGLSSH